MVSESILAAAVRDRATGEVCRALPDSEVQPFDEGGIECRGVLGVRQRLVEPPGSSNSLPSLNLDDSVVPSRLEHLSEEALGSEDLADDTGVVIEAISDAFWEHEVAGLIPLFLIRSVNAVL